MKLEINEWGELTLDISTMGFWISSGDPSDEHPPAGCRIEIDHEDVHIKLTPENAGRLQAALARAQFEFEVDPDNFTHVGADFIKCD